MGRGWWVSRDGWVGGKVEGGLGVVGIRGSRWSKDGRGSRGEGGLGVVRVRIYKGSRAGRGSVHTT